MCVCMCVFYLYVISNNIRLLLSNCIKFVQFAVKLHRFRCAEHGEIAKVIVDTPRDCYGM